MTTTIDSSYLLNSTKNQTKNAGASSLGKDDFLKILMTQLQNQDPLNPMQDKDFVAQMATFSTLEQITNMGTSMDKFIQVLEKNQLMNYSQLVGKEVTWSTPASADGRTPAAQGTGKVTSVQVKDGNVLATMEDGSEIDPANLTQMADPLTENGMLQASTLIGKTITYLNDQNLEKIAQVKSVSFKDGKTLFQLGDDLNTTVASSQITKIE